MHVSKCVCVWLLHTHNSCSSRKIVAVEGGGINRRAMPSSWTSPAHLLTLRLRLWIFLISPFTFPVSPLHTHFHFHFHSHSDSRSTSELAVGSSRSWKLHVGIYFKALGCTHRESTNLYLVLTVSWRLFRIYNNNNSANKWNFSMPKSRFDTRHTIVHLKKSEWFGAIWTIMEISRQSTRQNKLSMGFC